MKISMRVAISQSLLMGVLFLPMANAVESMGQHEHHSTMAVEPKPDAHPFVTEMDAGMGKMMTDMHAHGYSGNWDVDFLKMMIPHHQGAIDMAKLVLVHGQDPLTRQLAEEIIAAQQIEIEAMLSRVKALQENRQQDDLFPSLTGTRGVED